MTPGEVAELLAPSGGLPDVARLDDRARAYASAARAPATWRAYGVAWRAWASWATAAGVATLPADPVDVAAYLAARADAGARWSTLAHALQAHAVAHRLIGREPPGRAEVVRAVVAGIRRVRGTAATPAAALRLADLRACVDVLDARGGRLAIRDRAILLVGWCGAFRRSELVAIDREHVRREPEGIAVYLPRSKVDQDGAGAWRALPRGRRPALCPVRALDAWCAELDASGITIGAVFRRVDRWGHVHDRLTDRAVALVVERIGRAAGYPPGAFSGHSLRSGFATECAAAGVPEREIARQTGHRSMQVLRRYIHAGGLFVDHPASRVI